VAAWTAVRGGGGASGGVGEEDSVLGAGGGGSGAFFASTKPVHVGGPEKTRSSKPGLGRSDQVYRPLGMEMVIAVGN
jgi:hypothetical protein